MDSVLQTEQLVQEYPGVKALKGISIAVKAGEILALVGENGAGKSTLIRMLAGIEQPVSGKIFLKGKEQSFKSSSDSQNHGIAVVSQEFRQVGELTVAENIYLGHEIVSHGIIDKKATHAKAKALLDELGLDLDLDRYVSSLTIGDQQLVEIARALSLQFDVIIMDEPTAALNNSETEKLHRIVKRLAADGKAVIYVSHHLEEVFQICDTVDVLRNGKLVFSGPVADTNEQSLVEQMLGRKAEVYNKTDTTADKSPIGLQVKDVIIGRFPTAFNFEVRKGEILGIAGLVGSGRTEISRALFGQMPILSGSVLVDDKPVNLSNNRKAIRQGIFMLSEDRKNEGIIPHLDVIENSMIAKNKKDLPFAERFLPIAKKEKDSFDELKGKMNIKVQNDNELIVSLSGGNQQKVLFARAVLTGCSVLILNEPTRGVDVGAKIEIYQLIKELADSGVSIIVSSSDAPEIAAIANRCIVLFAGKEVAEFKGSDVTEENIIAASVGSMNKEGE
ncbi:sugar ABC transporter ATP-binding protein [Bifidobacterium sp. ESL0732]|uniref:sugar ABC transporter ATP-binding protein n=1 Tax=Bifidobacterium sp. ESL0732 TaxID=2983222 RepID=UPI0023F8699B|nr:sugar ABC transporter ATP-binding protein [Bifidobacterium sp. ESL0732]WEV63820.1 sugar ABC transporter ATP-binding protein [Bifidobacterium sp. ESL0732]